MHKHDLSAWRHEHVFGQDQRQAGERRTLMVVLPTAVMMVVEITALRAAIEQSTTDRVTDLHLWSIGHGIFSAQMTVVSNDPKPPSHYKALVPASLKVVHMSVEVHRRDVQ